jgi:hypothetical protein
MPRVCAVVVIMTTMATIALVTLGAVVSVLP